MEILVTEAIMPGDEDFFPFLRRRAGQPMVLTSLPVFPPPPAGAIGANAIAMTANTATTTTANRERPLASPLPAADSTFSE